ncbi:voltage-gated chloride channel family protein [Flavobacterium litorale]|uniref:Voltage-gated chloride channel family protein n=1 Tax=Flavobacterium litorale TaxID=2856519 RepID=A0ABX8V6M0_9FLAO|nr:voltage-gated chloride channel family protein [Flavobacterium litorale]QYJ68489.1 voltage-gated chloride channel family protein [Flavobacterium litorale]
MTKRNFAPNIANIPQVNYFSYLLKWLLLALLIGALIGSVTAFFLTSLNWATNWRENHVWIIALLPIGGLIIGLMYHYWGTSVVKGNNQLLEEFHSPKQIIPLKMAPLVLSGTLITHFFGGSAGREGTAVQMGGAIADQFTKLFKLKNTDRKIILIMGISAGFAAVFGTPLAGAIFALEVLVVGRVRYEAILPSFLVAVIANYVCDLWNVAHTHYTIPIVPEMDIINLCYTIAAGILFGLVALLFSKTTHSFGSLFKKTISYPPLRPLIGGICIALVVWLLGTTKYIGLGIPTIVDAFNHDLPQYDFLIKLLLTAFTLGAGFKGGEVTPLFFIGATLGNALFLFVPLPIALLAGMGFVAVFSGATNTPIACTLMGIELFGAESSLYIGVACTVAYLFSGHTGIYSSQIVGSPKHHIYKKLKGKNLNQL